MGLRMRRCACPIPSNGGRSCLVPPGAKETARLALLQLQHLSETKEESGDDKKSVTEEDAAIPSTAAIAAIGDGSGR